VYEKFYSDITEVNRLMKLFKTDHILIKKLLNEQYYKNYHSEYITVSNVESLKCIFNEHYC